MPVIRYIDKSFSPWQLDAIAKVNEIVTSYTRQGFRLTLRQVYYQFVSRDWLPQRWADAKTGSTNNQRSYDNLGSLISDARMAGAIDWNAIEDRTRALQKNTHWDTPADILAAVANQYKRDKWVGQRYRVEVWVEKDALENVLEKACRPLDVSYFSCRGYTSQTSMWEAGRRLKEYAEDGQAPVVLHLGDHDPSGIDMSRDIEDRLNIFMESDDLIFRRLALNMPQVEQYAPPPNPAKVTDSRAKKYMAEHGDESWELDALEPTVIVDLITKNVLEWRDEGVWERNVGRESEERGLLKKTSDGWDVVSEYVRKLKA